MSFWISLAILIILWQINTTATLVLGTLWLLAQCFDYYIDFDLKSVLEKMNRRIDKIVEMLEKKEVK